MRSHSRAAAGLAALVLVGACRGLPADPPPPALGDGPALATTPLTDLSDLAADLLEGSDLPALSLAVVVDGELAGHGAAGLRRVGWPDEVTAGDRFHIGSCTKSMTATLAAVLVEEGLLDWGTTIGDVFPDLAYAPVLDANESARHVTLEMLLTNTGGFATGIEPVLWAELWEGAGTPYDQRHRLLEACAAEPLPHWPTMLFEYSNTGFAIAGHMLEERAGMPWEELIRTRLFEPLGMATVGFRAPATPGLVDQPYGHLLQDGALVPVEPEPTGDNPRAIAPAGAVHLSALDLARYVRLHLGTSEAGLLSDASLARLHTAPGEPSGDFYAKGWFLAPRAWAGGTALTHAGSNTMWYAVIWAAPERDFAAVAMTNVSGEEAPGVCDQAVARLIEDFLGPPD